MADNDRPLTDTQRFDSARYKHWAKDYVRFSDLDPLGHTNNNAIGEYFENARAALFMEVTPQWPHRDTIFVLARISIDYRHELHIPADLRIGTCVTGFGRTSMRMASALFHNQTGIAYAETVSVLIEEIAKARRDTARFASAFIEPFGIVSILNILNIYLVVYYSWKLPPLA